MKEIISRGLTNCPDTKSTESRKSKINAVLLFGNTNSLACYYCLPSVINVKFKEI